MHEGRIMANLQLTSVTVGSPNPRELAAFYAQLLNGNVAINDAPPAHMPPEAGWAQVKTSSEFGEIALNFEYEAGWRELVWPSEPGEQHVTQHLDILVDDLDDAVAHAIQCGARLDPFQPQNTVRVMRDPHGHPFCLFLGE